MPLGLRPSEWLPVVATVSLFLLIVFATDAVASRTWADLVGLLYLVASPFLYRSLRSAVSESMPAAIRTVVRRVSPG